jgi:hypothetical protein
VLVKKRDDLVGCNSGLQYFHHNGSKIRAAAAVDYNRFIIIDDKIGITMQTGLLIEKADPVNTISNFNRTLKVNVIYLGVEHKNTLFGKYLLLHLTYNFLYQISKCQGRRDLHLYSFFTQTLAGLLENRNPASNLFLFFITTKAQNSRGALN